MIIIKILLESSGRETQKTGSWMNQSFLIFKINFPFSPIRPQQFYNFLLGN